MSSAKGLKEKLPDRSDFPDVDYWEVRLESEEQTTVNVRDGDVEVVAGRDVDRGNVRVLARGGWGFSSFNRHADVREHIARAVAFARSVGGGDASVLPLGPVEASVPARYERHPRDVSFEEKLDTVRSYDEIVREHPAVISTTVSYEDTVRNKVFLNSEGRLVEEELVYTRGIVRATGKADGVPESHSASFRYHAGFEAFVELRDRIPEMLEGLEEQLAAEDARGGTYDVIVNPMLGGVFVHEAFGHTSEADHFYRDAGMTDVMRLGRTMGSKAISIADDATLSPKHSGCIEYDDEGVEGKRTELMREGVLTGHLHNRTTAAVLGEELTGNARALHASFPPIVRMTATVIEPGEATLDDLLHEMGDGLLVKDSRGGMGGENFTFSARVGYLVEGGKLTKPVKNLTLTGNLFTTLKNIAACSNERELFSSAGGCGRGAQSPLPVSFGSPHVLIKNALIGGR
ncbi:MAG: TldD/PmbA family protein [Candidatus Zixiibacteriota bacterium]|jgi:TldD protein